LLAGVNIEGTKISRNSSLNGGGWNCETIVCDVAQRARRCLAAELAVAMARSIPASQ
jgi:hypothetical protein